MTGMFRFSATEISCNRTQSLGPRAFAVPPHPSRRASLGRSARARRLEDFRLSCRLWWKSLPSAMLSTSMKIGTGVG